MNSGFAELADLVPTLLPDLAVADLIADEPYLSTAGVYREREPSLAFNAVVDLARTGFYALDGPDVLRLGPAVAWPSLSRRPLQNLD